MKILYTYNINVIYYNININMILYYTYKYREI